MKKIDTYQAIKQEGILLNANESYKNLSNTILEEIQEAIGNIDFHRYPEDSCELLCNRYASYLNLDPNQLIVGNGSDEMLGMMIGLSISNHKKLYTVAPDFSMYDYYVGMHNGDIIKYQNCAEDDFNVDDFINYGKAQDVDMILFSNPNNPTGKLINQEDICKILTAFKDKYVIVDEAYGEFCESSMISYLDQYDNLLITKTLSKAFSLAAIRCGFLIGNSKTIAKIKPYKVPYNVNSLTQCVAEIVLSHKKEIEADIAYIKRARVKMYKQYLQMKREDLTLFDSHTNFFYGRAKHKENLLKALQKENIIIRDYQDDSFRITIGSEEENKKVMEVLKNF